MDEFETDVDSDVEVVAASNGHVDVKSNGKLVTSVPILGPIRRSPRGDWRTEVVLDCEHPKAKGSGPGMRAQDYGTASCTKCGGSRGVDGLWRKIVPA